MNKRNNEVAASAAVVTGIALAVIVALWALIAGISWVGARATPQAGEIGVVRAGASAVWIGDWFNGHQIKEIVPPGSGSKSIGLGSSVHWYPANSVQRTYTITADKSRGDRPGVDVVETSTSDGIRVGVEGTFYFTTAFCAPDTPSVCPHGAELLRDFDNRFGVRTFPIVGKAGDEAHAWDGNDGWSAFLDAVIRPIIDNDLRQSLGSVSCAQLVASCALVYNQNLTAVRSGSAQNSATLTKIQNQINANLQSDIARVLGKDYFSNVQFLISSKPSLPDAIQGEIDHAQGQFAAVGTARAQVQQAQLQAQANQERQKGYLACSACAAIDELKAIPSNVTTFAPGAGFAITK